MKLILQKFMPLFIIAFMSSLAFTADNMQTTQGARAAFEQYMSTQNPTETEDQILTKLQPVVIHYYENTDVSTLSKLMDFYHKLSSNFERQKHPTQRKHLEKSYQIYNNIKTSYPGTAFANMLFPSDAYTQQTLMYQKAKAEATTPENQYSYAKLNWGVFNVTKDRAYFDEAKAYFQLAAQQGYEPSSEFMRDKGELKE